MKYKIIVKEGYFSSGPLRYKEQYLNDKKHGEQLYYFSYGKLRYKNHYINGKLVSQKEWDKFNNIGVNTPHFNLL